MPVSTAAGSIYQEPPKPETFGIPLETTLTGPDGKPILDQNGNPIIIKAAPVKDDFSSVGEEDLTAPPRSDGPCKICHEVHAKEGYPLCICGKCGQFSRIVWCGQCVDCTFTRFSELAGVGPEVALWVIDAMSPGYAKYKQKQQHDLAKTNKMPWEE